jgi:DNA repair exonuclease SbcCD nuclease subunit
MHEIVCVGDVHEGLSFDYRIDPETGVSERALDLHLNFARAAQWAIDHQASLFCVLGDLFDRTHVAPIFREMVRRDVIEPLGKAGIEVWILAGNHDQPRRAARSTSLDDFRGYSHVRVFREPKIETRTIDGRRIGFILIPYLHPDEVVEQVRGRLGKEVPREEAYEAARRVWKGWIENRATDLEYADLRILFGHFELQGARYASTTPPEVVPHDFTFARDMIPASVNLAVFGHIHMHQVLWDNVVYTGAPERIDWGERLDRKGFITVHANGAWSFVELPARPMEKVEVNAAVGDDVTRQVLDALPKDVAGKLVRIEVRLPDELRPSLDEHRLTERLQVAFHYELRLVSTERARITTDEFTMDPTRLLAEYVDKNFEGHPRKDAIKAEAQRLLKEALA